MKTNLTLFHETYLVLSCGPQWLFSRTIGGLFTLDDTKVQTFLTGHGSAEFQAYCDSFVPMYKQCSGTWNSFKWMWVIHAFWVWSTDRFKVNTILHVVHQTRQTVFHRDIQTPRWELRIEHCTGIAEVMDSNRVQALISQALKLCV